MPRRKFLTDADVREELNKQVGPAINVLKGKLKGNSNFDAWKVLDKFVSNKSTTEITDPDGKALPIFILNGGYIPPNRSIIEAPAGSYSESTPKIQDSGVAQAGEEDYHRPDRISTTKSD